ncbi:vacuolar protein sorting-associated protein 16B [Leptidea sinapis]|uniref:vacuolar protein sorting-associated protein 16B n=1 Tax=Leptidea sinapis TaxID=189913 RepID=UPI00213BB24F|nr:vacuolar protein sorting-associated protein 16B [Leptidea sinapis]
MDDDDYWNTSETKESAFSFDDVLSPQEILAIGKKACSGQSEDSVFNSSNINSTRRDLVPLASLVSPKALELIVLAQSGNDLKDAMPEQHITVAVTLRRLVLGRSCSLHVHRSMKSKTELLDGAIELGDGNAILAIVCFLLQTLNKKLVHELLSSRPLALSHYVGYLHGEGKIAELTDLLTMLGRSSEAAMFQFEHMVRCHGDDVEALLRKSGNLQKNHFTQPHVDGHYIKMLTDYCKLLEWQKCADKKELRNKSSLRCLLYCCESHWHEGAGNIMSPLTLCQRQQITPLQYDWVVLNVHANANKWDIVESLFTKKNWFGRTTVSTHIPIETLLSRLAELKASEHIMATCVAKIQSNEERIRLAHKYKIHSVIAESAGKQKDRSGLFGMT